MQIENRKGRVTRPSGGLRSCFRGHPPAGKVRCAGAEVTKVDRGEGEASGFRCAVDRVGGVEDELPDALIEEQAGGEIRAEERDCKRKRERLAEPDRTDDLDLSVRGGVGGAGGVAWLVAGLG